MTAWIIANYINSNSDTLEARVYPANQLGEERAVVEGMQLGAGATMHIGGTAIHNNFNKRMGVLDLPFMWRNYDHAHKVLDGKVGETLAAEHEKLGLKVLGWQDSWGYRNVITTKKEVKKAEDLKGLKIRTIQTPTYVAALNAMGASATPMAFGEVYTSLQTGVLDGFEHSSAVAYTGKYYEVAKYITLTEHLFGPTVTVISKKEWDGYTDKEKQVVAAAAKLGQDVNRSLSVSGTRVDAEAQGQGDDRQSDRQVRVPQGRGRAGPARQDHRRRGPAEDDPRHEVELICVAAVVFAATRKSSAMDDGRRDTAVVSAEAGTGVSTPPGPLRRGDDVLAMPRAQTNAHFAGAHMIAKSFRAVDRSVEYALFLIFLAFTLVGGLQVFNRFVLGLPLSWSEEFQKFGHIWMVMLAIPVRTGAARTSAWTCCCTCCRRRRRRRSAW